MKTIESYNLVYVLVLKDSSISLQPDMPQMWHYFWCHTDSFLTVLELMLVLLFCVNSQMLTISFWNWKGNNEIFNFIHGLPFCQYSLFPMNFQKPGGIIALLDEAW